MRKLLEKSVALLIFVGLLGVGSIAQAAPPSAAEILDLLDQTMGAEAKIMSQSMTLIAANGQQRTREMQMWSKQGTNGDQMLARFLAPADVKGTGILMNADDMWLYLPALGKVRRVASHAKKGSFMGSDLTFDDMEQLGSKGFTPFYEPSLLGQEKLEGSSTFVLKLVPVDTSSDFSYLKMWVDSDIWLPRRIEYFGPEGTVLKVLTTWDLRQTEGRWMAQKMIMEDQQKSSQTILEVKEVSFLESLDDSIFTTRSLERGM